MLKDWVNTFVIFGLLAQSSSAYAQLFYPGAGQAAPKLNQPKPLNPASKTSSSAQGSVDDDAPFDDAPVAETETETEDGTEEGGEEEASAGPFKGDGMVTGLANGFVANAMESTKASVSAAVQAKIQDRLENGSRKKQQAEADKAARADLANRRLNQNAETQAELEAKELAQKEEDFKKQQEELDQALNENPDDEEAVQALEDLKKERESYSKVLAENKAKLDQEKNLSKLDKRKLQAEQNKSSWEEDKASGKFVSKQTGEDESAGLFRGRNRTSTQETYDKDGNILESSEERLNVRGKNDRVKSKLTRTSKEENGAVTVTDDQVVNRRNGKEKSRNVVTQTFKKGEDGEMVEAGSQTANTRFKRNGTQVVRERQFDENGNIVSNKKSFSAKIATTGQAGVAGTPGTITAGSRRELRQQMREQVRNGAVLQDPRLQARIQQQNARLQYRQNLVNARQMKEGETRQDMRNRVRDVRFNNQIAKRQERERQQFIQGGGDPTKFQASTEGKRSRVGNILGKMGIGNGKNRNRNPASADAPAPGGASGSETANAEPAKKKRDIFGFLKGCKGENANSQRCKDKAAKKAANKDKKKKSPFAFLQSCKGKNADTERCKDKAKKKADKLAKKGKDGEKKGGVLSFLKSCKNPKNADLAKCKNKSADKKDLKEKGKGLLAKAFCPRGKDPATGKCKKRAPGEKSAVGKVFGSIFGKKKK